MNIRMLLMMFISIMCGNIMAVDNVFVIKGASYKVCDGDSWFGHGIPCSGKQVTFYTYDAHSI